MKRVMVRMFFRSLTLGLTTLAALSAWSLPGEAVEDPKPFQVFDGTLYSNKPDLSQYGIRPIAIAYAGKFGLDWYKQADRLPNVESVRAVAREVRQQGNVAVLDIEHWSLKGLPDSVTDSLAKYKTVLGWFQEAASNVSVGYYGSPPIRDYWRAIRHKTSREYQAWMDENDQLRPLASAVDVFFPSLYTFYPDQTGWKTYAVAQIEEARRYGNGKPVYVFLWPQYHDSNRQLGGQYLPDDYWLLQLRTAKEHADGIVIWGGWGGNNRPAGWDEHAPWWKVTKGFMKTLDAGRVSSR
ncbi:MAG: hypothetical protein GDA67_10260 [Nitrospira sp. CR1.3]|nr:hypothetical protein [Nitrospira sp. CR1.3]